MVRSTVWVRFRRTQRASFCLPVPHDPAGRSIARVSIPRVARIKLALCVLPGHRRGAGRTIALLLVSSAPVPFLVWGAERPFVPDSLPAPSLHCFVTRESPPERRRRSEGRQDL